MDKNIEARLNPSHIDPPDLEAPELPSDDELRESVVKGTLEREDKGPEKGVKRRSDDRRSHREFTFSLNFMDETGKAWLGEFTTKILSIHDRQRSGILRAQLGGGLPLESFDAVTAELNMIMAHLTFSLTQRPPWAESLRTLDDPSILQAIYAEVASHEAFFLGWTTD